MYSIIWAAISFGTAIWLGTIDYKLLSWVFYIFGGMCLIYPLNMFNLKREGYADGFSQTFEDTQSQNFLQITCQHCGINEVFTGINERNNSKIYRSHVLYTKKDGSRVVGLLCFNCNYVSEIAVRENTEELEYLKHYKLDKETKKRFIDFAQSFSDTDALKKIKKIKVKEGRFFNFLLGIFIIGLIIYIAETSH